MINHKLETFASAHCIRWRGGGERVGEEAGKGKRGETWGSQL